LLCWYAVWRAAWLPAAAVASSTGCSGSDASTIDALSYLQLRFLDDPKATRLVQATIAGVAAGLQNTG